MTFTKDPNAVLDYAIDWSRWLADDEIASSTWTIPTGLTQVSASNSTTKATIWLSGGAAGQSYTITNRITTTGGRTDERSFVISVEER
ncbi:MAG: phage fiber-tail adaptor protein [Chloroflexota bacterium]